MDTDPLEAELARGQALLQAELDGYCRLITRIFCLLSHLLIVIPIRIAENSYMVNFLISQGVK